MPKKIYLVSNIPAYRQHIIYIDYNRLQTIYKLYAEGIYNVDIRQLNDNDNIQEMKYNKTASKQWTSKFKKIDFMKAAGTKKEKTQFLLFPRLHIKNSLQTQLTGRIQQ